MDKEKQEFLEKLKNKEFTDNIKYRIIILREVGSLQTFELIEKETEEEAEKELQKIKSYNTGKILHIERVIND